MVWICQKKGGVQGDFKPWSSGNLYLSVFKGLTAHKMA